ncbi:AAA family ATPase [Actinomadura sp. 9N407]|uniref:AAA family ATPase n=1 Tax=Actinomadura sp. 9N407 TaxID=3375154 RepID=UPI00379CF240
MHVTRLEIAGVRGFDGPRRVDLEFPQRPDGSYAGWTVLAGRNGSGKSSLLQAMMLALGGPENGGTLAMGGVWKSDGEDTLEPLPFPEPGVRVHLARSPEHDPFSTEGGVIAAVMWSRSGGFVRWRTQSSRSDQPKPESDGAWSPRPEGWLYLGYGPFRRHSTPGVGVQDSAATRGAGFQTLFDEDATLVEGVSWLIGQHLLRLEGKAGAAELLEAVLRLLGDGLLPDGFRICRVDSDGLWVSRADGREFPMRRMSDGYRTVGALVVDIVRRMHLSYGDLRVEERDGIPTLPYPGVILIDEVDAHLHVSWQKKIGGWLKAHFPEMQFIVTTHSPYICQSADPGGLIRLPGPDEQAPPRAVDEDLYARIVYGSGDDAVLSELFGLETPYSDEAERLRDRLGELEGRVLDGAASEEEVAEYRDLSKKLQSSLGARVHEVSSRLGLEP